MISTFTLDLHLRDDLSPERRAAAVTHARDDVTLGIDFELADSITDDTPFDQVLAHLLMFDPAWLLAHDTGIVVGWTADPTHEGV